MTSSPLSFPESSSFLVSLRRRERFWSEWKKIWFFFHWLFTVTKLRSVNRRIPAVKIPLPQILSRRLPAEQEAWGLWERDCFLSGCSHISQKQQSLSRLLSCLDSNFRPASETRGFKPVLNNAPSQAYPNPDDHTGRNTKTPEFKPLPNNSPFRDYSNPNDHKIHGLLRLLGSNDLLYFLSKLYFL